MRKVAVRSILVFAILLAVGAVARAQQPKKVPRIGYLSQAIAARDSARAEAIRLALRERGYSKDKTSPSSTDMRRGSSIGFLILRQSWCVSRLMSS